MIRTKFAAAALGVLIAGTAVAPSFADTAPKPAVSGASTTTAKTHVRHHRRHRAAPAASTQQPSTPSTSSQKK